MTIKPAVQSKKMLFSILTVESAKDLLKHRSFILLIFLILAADRFLRHNVDLSALKNSLSFSAWQDQLPQIIFVDLPRLIGEWLFSPMVLGLLAGLFLFKQVASLWPSSSLRRWHDTRKDQGLLSSLFSLKGSQFLWDLTALTMLICITFGWGVLNFSWCYAWWRASGGTVPAWCFVTMMVLVWPVILAGLSYSSKLAVLQNGSYGDKFGLYLKLFSNPRIFFGSWLFFLARIVLESLFVAIIPLSALLYLDNVLLRTLLACASITPSYSYLKMASFKFFLFIYSPYPLIQLEFKDYLASMAGMPMTAGQKH
jgi:hypothetical protein